MPQEEVAAQERGSSRPVHSGWDVRRVCPATRSACCPQDSILEGKKRTNTKPQNFPAAKSEGDSSQAKPQMCEMRHRVGGAADQCGGSRKCRRRLRDVRTPCPAVCTYLGGCMSPSSPRRGGAGGAERED